MRNFDRLLIDPTGEDLDRALGEAVKAVNGKRRRHRLPWPPADWGEYRCLRAQEVEGRRQWEGHGEPARRDFSEVVWTAWWSDAVGRRHHRVVGQRAAPMEVGYYPLFTPAASGRPPLALVHPEGAVVRTLGRKRDVLVCCSCGVIGQPRALGWMGTCCGPCHDRREEGEGLSIPENRSGMTVAWSSDLRTAALRGYDGGDRYPVVIWDVPGNCERLRLDNVPFDQLALSPDGNLLAAGGYSHNPPAGHALLWDLTRKEARPLLGPIAAEVWSLAFAPDGRTVAVAVSRQGVWLLDSGTGQEKRFLRGYFGGRKGIAFSPDGRLIATAPEAEPVGFLELGASLGHTVALWDAASGELRDRIQTHCYVPNVAFTPNGKYLAIWAGANNDPDIVLWDVETRRQRDVLAESRAAGQSVAFTPDSRYVACLAGHIGTLRVWEVNTGWEKCCLQWADFSPSGVAFTEDGRLMVARTMGEPMDCWPVSLLGLIP
jgi:hypothetical protein